MKNSIRLFVLLVAICFWCEPDLAQVPAPARATTVVKAEKFLRTELYFGRSKPDGTVVSDNDWNKFLAEIVTPRFPDGFTVVNAVGQYREKSGRIVQEGSAVVIFLYSRGNRRASNAKIEEIRSFYVNQFKQESVLRIDFSKPVKVSF